MQVITCIHKTSLWTASSPAFYPVVHGMTWGTKLSRLWGPLLLWPCPRYLAYLDYKHFRAKSVCHWACNTYVLWQGPLDYIWVQINIKFSVAKYSVSSVLRHTTHTPVLYKDDCKLLLYVCYTLLASLVYPFRTKFSFKNQNAAGSNYQGSD